MTTPPRRVVEAMASKYGFKSLTDLEKACSPDTPLLDGNTMSIGEVFLIAGIAAKRLPGVKDDARLVNRWNRAKRRFS